MDSMTLIKRDHKWWILDPNDPEPIGPYETRREADDELRGIRRFDKYGHLRQFWAATQGTQ